MADINTDDELRRADSQRAAILAIAADAIISLDESLRITLFNDGAAAMFGYTRGEVIGEPLDILIPSRFRPRHHHHVSDFAASPVAAKKMGERQEIYALRKDGTEFPAEASIAKQELGGQTSFMVVVRDVTERNQIQAALAKANTDLERRVAKRTRELEAEIQRREETQAALIQAQRMEAFGQLTGGIAHDFNNLLTIIIGNLELVLDGVDRDRADAYLKRAADAANMGASLTKRLLLFARRQRLTPEVLNLNDLIKGLTEILKRSLGELIALQTDLAPFLWQTRADASEIENAILNLALNARDAMPAGGVLRIATKNVTASRDGEELRDYVLISVTDDGEGMAPDVLSRAMEPFFTTKAPGRGSGLGLSTVYGFAKQSGGFASIASKQGEGSTVCIYLPRVETRVEILSSGRSGEEIHYAKNSETVLVVEDNAEVRELTLQRVEGLGYVALEASSGSAAMDVFKSGTRIDVLLTDIVMAGLSGYELAAWTKQHFPDTKILLATGFAAEEMKQDPAALQGIQTLRKPYKRVDLAVALRNALQSNEN